MSRFNRAFSDNVDEGLFMTAFYAIMDPKANDITYVSAGHDPPLLYSFESGQVDQINHGGICLGVVEDTTYIDKTINMQLGDVLLLYTDGATDVRNDGNRLGVEGLAQLLISNAHETAQRIVSNVSDGIRQFGKGRQSDDIALVVLKRLRNVPAVNAL